MAVGLLFSFPRMEKSGDDVTVQEVPLWGPTSLLTVVDAIVYMYQFYHLTLLI